MAPVIAAILLASEKNTSSVEPYGAVLFAPDQCQPFTDNLLSCFDGQSSLWSTSWLKKSKQNNAWLLQSGRHIVRRCLAGIGPNISNLGQQWNILLYHTGTSEDWEPSDNTPYWKTSGLARDYVTQWSYWYWMIKLTYWIANVKGGASDALGNDPAVAAPVKEELRPSQLHQNHSSYWEQSAFTSGRL